MENNINIFLFFSFFFCFSISQTQLYCGNLITCSDCTTSTIGSGCDWCVASQTCTNTNASCPGLSGNGGRIVTGGSSLCACMNNNAQDIGEYTPRCKNCQSSSASCNFCNQNSNSVWAGFCIPHSLYEDPNILPALTDCNKWATSSSTCPADYCSTLTSCDDCGSAKNPGCGWCDSDTVCRSTFQTKCPNGDAPQRSVCNSYVGLSQSAYIGIYVAIAVCVLITALVVVLVVRRYRYGRILP